MALEGEDRRFRCEATMSLALVAAAGPADQRAKAKETLETLARSTDVVLASNARWFIANPIDGQHIDELFAPPK